MKRKGVDYYLETVELKVKIQRKTVVLQCAIKEGANKSGAKAICRR